MGSYRVEFAEENCCITCTAGAAREQGRERNVSEEAKVEESPAVAAKALPAN